MISIGEVLKDIERQKLEGNDTISTAFNIGLSTAIIIIKYFDELEKIRGKKEYHS